MPLRFLVPLVKKLSQSDIEDFSVSLSSSFGSGDTKLHQPVVRDLDTSSQEEASVVQVGAFESQEMEETGYSFSSSVTVSRVHSQESRCLKFPGKEKCLFYQKSSFKYKLRDEPYCRAGDEAILERFPGYGYTDDVDALSCLSFMSPPQSPPRLNGWSPIKASMLTDQSELDIPKTKKKSASLECVESMAKRVRFSIETESPQGVVDEGMSLVDKSEELGMCKEMVTVDVKKDSTASSAVWTPFKSPPTSGQLLETADCHGIRACRHQAAFYSRVEDVVASK